MLPLTFAEPNDYAKIKPTDRISLVNLESMTPGKVSFELMTNQYEYLFFHLLANPMSCKTR